MSILSRTHDLLSALNREDGAAIVALIDLKTESDMERVLNKLDSMEKSFDSRLDSMEKSFDSRLDSMEKGFDSRLTAMDQKIDSKINTLYWVVGIAATLAVAILRFTH